MASPSRTTFSAVFPTAPVTTKTARVPPTNDAARLTISPPALQVGRTVSIAGTGCPPGYWATADLDQSHNTNYPSIFSTSAGLYDEEDFAEPSGQTGAVVGADGVWTMTATVPMVAPGAAVLSGVCKPAIGDDASLIAFFYPPTAITVATTFALSVAPGTSVAAGTTLTVRPLGGGCPIPSSVQVSLYSIAPPVRSVATGTLQGAAPASQTENDWIAASVPTAAAVPPGTYLLEADCVYSRGAVMGSYAPISITVR